MLVRKIKKEDNEELAALIRQVFREYGVARPGTVYTDPATDHLYELFLTKGSSYFIAEDNGSIAGGCGIFPTTGLDEGCAELVNYT
jgi:putative acetyltransferase